MSYQEERTLINIVTGLIIIGTYSFYAFDKYNSGTIAADDLQFWARTILTFSGIGVVSIIVIQIVFHILLSISIAIEERKGDEKEIEKRINVETHEDERDQHIELKASRASSYISGAGFVIALIAILLNYSPIVMINILFFACSIGCTVEGIIQLFYYRNSE